MWEVLGTAGDCPRAQGRDATGIRTSPSPGSDGCKIPGNGCRSQSYRLCRSLGQRNASPCLAGRSSAPAWTDLRFEWYQYHSYRGTSACPYVFLLLDPLHCLYAWRLGGDGTLASAGRLPRGAHENPVKAEYAVGCRFHPGCTGRSSIWDAGELEHDLALLELAADVGACRSDSGTGLPGVLAASLTRTHIF